MVFQGRIGRTETGGEPVPGGTSGYESGRQNGATRFEMRRRENKTKRKNEK